MALLVPPPGLITGHPVYQKPELLAEQPNVDAVHAARQVALDRAFAEHPARFINRAPVPLAKPTATWINRPAPKAVPEGRPQS